MFLIVKTLSSNEFEMRNFKIINLILIKKTLNKYRYIYKNLLANYTHQRNTWNNPWAQRFIDFARSHKT